MCLVESCLFGLLSLRTGCVMMGWISFTASLTMFLSELCLAFIDVPDKTPYKFGSSIFIAEALSMVCANTILLLGLYESRFELCVFWLMIAALSWFSTLLDIFIIPPDAAPFLLWHLQATFLRLTFLSYMYLVVFSFYIAVRGTGRTVLGREIRAERHGSIQGQRPRAFSLRGGM
ncbi:hypothetical protein R5R35_007430 [Gryllus longicercus]|uniref:Uncharacterized protein n=1 Tax=Gryllus longicercus TaxID=2509291 RepID=A0AAN9YYW2_9ORTH